MRYINCARNKEEQNLEAFQYSHDEEIHYQSLKCIYPGNELLAWYSDRYAGELEIIEKGTCTCTYIHYMLLENMKTICI